MNDTVDTPKTAPSVIEACPICGSTELARLVPDWNDGRAIPIVGCGNPWHYIGLVTSQTTASPFNTEGAG